MKRDGVGERVETDGRGIEREGRALEDCAGMEGTLGTEGRRLLVGTEGLEGERMLF